MPSISPFNGMMLGFQKMFKLVNLPSIKAEKDAEIPDFNLSSIRGVHFFKNLRNSPISEGGRSEG